MLIEERDNPSKLAPDTVLLIIEYGELVPEKLPKRTQDRLQATWLPEIVTAAPGFACVNWFT